MLQFLLSLALSAHATDPNGCEIATLGAPARPPALQANIRIDQRVGFSNSSEESTLSSDGRLSAVSRSLGKDEIEVLVFDIEDRQVLERANFTRVKSLHFIEGSQWLAIDGTLRSDGNVAKLYLLGLGNRSSSEGRALIPFGASMPSLDLPHSRYWGVGVEQVVSRSGLGTFLVLQDSANALGTVRYQPSNPMANPHTSLLNQNGTIFDKRSLRPLKSIKFTQEGEEIQPIMAELNPKSSLVALHAVDPLVAHKRKDSIYVIDLKNPSEELFAFPFGRSGLDFPMGSMAYTSASNQFHLSWDSTGERLLILEGVSGSVIQVNVKTKEQTVDRRDLTNRWPIAGGAILNDGSLFLVRSGRMTSGNQLLRDEALFASIDDGPLVELHLSQQVSAVRDRVRNRAQGRVVDQIFELNGGQHIALAIEDQILLLDRAHPNQQLVINPSDVTAAKNFRLGQIIKVSDSTLRLIDREKGIFDLTIRP
ncbi:MAG: hypothetical protein AB7F86_03185 [Bdellovibrionales bacterium]